MSDKWVGVSRIGDNYQVQLNLSVSTTNERVKYRHRWCSLRSHRQPLTTPWEAGLPKDWKR